MKNEETPRGRRFSILHSSFFILHFAVLWLAIIVQAHAEDNVDGSGPQISVPRNLPPDPAHALPKPNWIDQSQADADSKSRGCLECHAGVEPMHASKNVVLGCTDCHGGNATPGLIRS